MLPTIRITIEVWDGSATTRPNVKTIEHQFTTISTCFQLATLIENLITMIRSCIILEK
jgi:hypothetical protein